MLLAVVTQFAMTERTFGTARATKGFGVFDDHETDWTFLRTLAQMSEKGAEVGECLPAARRINERDVESWITEWATLAERLEQDAEDALDEGHEISARELFLRAQNYYGAAEHGCSPSHPRFFELWEKSQECFQRACSLFDPPIEVHEVQVDDWELPAYYWRPANDDQERPTMVAIGGNDELLEALTVFTGPAAVRRGYNYFTIDYPGHRGAVLLYDDCVKRPDYEVPFAEILDYVEDLPGVDGRIAMAGYSFGGYVAPRVAIHDDRVDALIANSPMIDVPKIQSGLVNPLVGRVPGPLLERLVERRLDKSPLAKAYVKYGFYSFGEPEMTISEWLKTDEPIGSDMVVEDDLDEITCPTLALVGEDEGEEMIIQTEMFIDGVSADEKDLYVFTLEEDGSDDHVQMDNWTRGQQITFDWLDGIFST